MTNEAFMYHKPDWMYRISTIFISEILTLFTVFIPSLILVKIDPGYTFLATRIWNKILFPVCLYYIIALIIFAEASGHIFTFWAFGAKHIVRDFPVDKLSKEIRKKYPQFCKVLLKDCETYLAANNLSFDQYVIDWINETGIIDEKRISKRISKHVHKMLKAFMHAKEFNRHEDMIATIVYNHLRRHYNPPSNLAAASVAHYYMGGITHVTLAHICIDVYIDRQRNNADEGLE